MWCVSFLEQVAVSAIRDFPRPFRGRRGKRSRREVLVCVLDRLTWKMVFREEVYWEGDRGIG